MWCFVFNCSNQVIMQILPIDVVKFIDFDYRQLMRLGRKEMKIDVFQTDKKRNGLLNVDSFKSEIFDYDL